MSWVLIITLFSPEVRTGPAVAMHDFNSQSSCENARVEWLKSIPRSENGKFYTVSNSPRAVCVPK